MDPLVLIHPRNSEYDHSLRLDQPFQHVMLEVLGIPFDRGFNPLEYLVHGLQKIRLVLAPSPDLLKNLFDFPYHDR
jgi:hypothetical protein